MTAFRIFNDCTIEDINHHLVGLPANFHHDLLPRDDFLPSPVRMKITVDEARAPRQTAHKSARKYWLPGETITGTLSIESDDPITLAQVRIRLDGKTTLTLDSLLLFATVSRTWLTHQ